MLETINLNYIKIMTNEIRLMTPLQAHKVKQKNRFITEFKEMKKQFEEAGEKPTTQALCRLLQGKYKKSTDMLRRYLKEEGVID